MVCEGSGSKGTACVVEGQRCGRHVGVVKLQASCQVICFAWNFAVAVGQKSRVKSTVGVANNIVDAIKGCW